jgi:hypothetical protein
MVGGPNKSPWEARDGRLFPFYTMQVHVCLSVHTYRTYIHSHSVSLCPRGRVGFTVESSRVLSRCSVLA